jgi:hypothetical protein
MVSRKLSIIAGQAATALQVGTPDEVNEFFPPIYLIFLAALGPGVLSASNRNEYQKQQIKFLGSKAWRVSRIVCGMCDSRHVANPIGLHGLLRGELYYSVSNLNCEQINQNYEM